MTGVPPDWQLPPGVSRGLWQYLHSEEIALAYDAGLEGNALAALDIRFVEQQCPAPGKMIDLGCGTGRLLLHLGSRGRRVTGVDLSGAMLKVAAEKAAAAGVAVDLVQANLVDLGCFGDESFDHAACLFSTLGMVAGAEQRKLVVCNVRRLLRRGGVFVLHVHNRWFNFWQPGGWKWLVQDFGRSLLGRTSVGDRLMPAHGTLPPLTLHLFSRREVLRTLREAGFQICKVLPVGLRAERGLSWPFWFGWLRAYGYLVAAEKRD
jgi:ubiquinone/menaquinone biosynthesis C-methylase UbiE